MGVGTRDARGLTKSYARCQLNWHVMWGWYCSVVSGYMLRCLMEWTWCTVQEVEFEFTGSMAFTDILFDSVCDKWN